MTLNFHLNLYKVLLFCLFAHLYIRKYRGMYYVTYGIIESHMGGIKTSFTITLQWYFAGPMREV